MADDYTAFCDRVLVALAEAQEPPGLGILRIEKLCRSKGIEAHPTWLELVSGDLERLGYGKDFSGKGESDFLINGSGLRRADELRRLASAPVRRRLSSANWPMWSVITAVLALLAYIVFEAVK